MNRNVVVAVVLILVVGAGVAFATMGDDEPAQTAASSSSPASADTSKSDDAKMADGKAGSYVDYSAGAISAGGDGKRLIFFHAPWCTYCRAAEENIKSGEIPAGTTIYKADFDSSTDLRKKYGVTQQSTFVEVDESGALVKKFNGYGQDTTLDVLAEEFSL